MNPLLRSFRDNLWLAAQKAGLKKGELQKRYDLSSFELDEIKPSDSAQEIAAKALYYFCIEDGRFNNFTAGILAVMTFLGTHCGGPDHLNRRAQAYQDLRTIMGSGARYEAILNWVKCWYQ